MFDPYVLDETDVVDPLLDGMEAGGIDELPQRPSASRANAAARARKERKEQAELNRRSIPFSPVDDPQFKMASFKTNRTSLEMEAELFEVSMAENYDRLHSQRFLVAV
jgi:hypothetical protein